MNVLIGLKNKLLQYGSMQKAGNFSSLKDIQSRDVEDVAVDNHGEGNVKHEMINSNNSKLIVSKFEFFIGKLNGRFFKDHSPLDTFFNDIINWKSNVYIGGSKPVYNWYYRMISDDNTKKYMIKLLNRKRVIMQVEVVTSLDDEILSFDAKYHSNVSLSDVKLVGGIVKSDVGTTVVNVNCYDVNNMRISQSVYNLDLLNGVEYSSSEISSNHIGTITVPLFQTNKCEVIKKIKY